MKFQKTFAIFGIAIALGMVSLLGCQKSNNAVTDTSGTAATAETAAIPPEMEKYKDAIQKLPKEEWIVVYEQKICPVSDEVLGSMGTPIKVTVEGQDVYICCEGCRKSLEENPKKYLEKLSK